MKSILLISLSCFWLSVFGQATFQLSFGSEFHDIPFDVLETENHYLLVGSHRDLFNYTSTGFLYKLSKNGEVLDSFEFTKPDTNILLTNIVQSSDGPLLLGQIGLTNSIAYNFNSIFVLRLSDSLQILNEKIVTLPMLYSDIFGLFFKYQDPSVYAAGAASNQDFSTYKRDVFFYEINLLDDSIDSIDSTFIQYEGLQYASGLYIDPTMLDKYIYSVGNWGFPTGYGPGYYVKLNRNNNLLQIDTLPDGLQWENFSINISDNQFLLSGRQIVVPDPNATQTEYRCSIFKLNHDFQTINAYEYHQGLDTLSLLASVNTFDTTSNGEIFLSGCSNVIAQYFPYQQQPTWIFLSKLDGNLNEIWTHFYGGDIMYQVFSVKATTDNGAIITCGSYDYNTQYLEHNIFVMKVNEGGLIVGTGEEPAGLTVQDAIVYPNPGSNQMKIQSGPQINGALFELFGLNGNLILSATLDDWLETLSTDELSPGTYPYRVTFKNKIVGEGKWVKQ